MKFLSATFILLSSLICVGQSNLTFDSLREVYDADMKIASNTFSEKYYPNRQTIYSLNEKQFLKERKSKNNESLTTCLRG